MKTKWCLIAAGLMLIAGVAYAKAAPEWINTGASKQFPQQTFLTGVGVGTTMDTARANARAEIAKIFRSNITQSSETTESESRTQTDSTREMHSLLSANMATSVSTDQIVDGIEIATTYYDKHRHLYYAFATLNKQKTLVILSQTITDKEEAIKQHLDAAQSATNAWEKMQHLSAALGCIDERDTLVAKRHIVEPVPSQDVSGYTRSDVEKQRGDVMAHIVFSVSGNEGMLNTLVAGILTQTGFTVATDTTTQTQQQFMLVVQSSVTTAAVTRDDPQWKFCQWKGSIQIATTDHVMASFADQGIASHVNPDNAREKALVDARKSLSMWLGKRMDEVKN